MTTTIYVNLDYLGTGDGSSLRIKNGKLYFANGGLVTKDWADNETQRVVEDATKQREAIMKLFEGDNAG